MKILDLIVAKDPYWTSYQALIHHGKIDRTPYMPRWGMTFKARADFTPFTSETVNYWNRDDAGNWMTRSMRTAHRDHRFVKFNVDYSQIKVPPDAAPLPRISKKFFDTFAATPFYEQGDNYLVSLPIVTDLKDAAKGEPMSVTFILELYSDGNTVGMVQRAYWSDSYIGTYGCC
ncbi:MAG: hypothetical protein RQ899_11980 [Pseudomonadales bacterium]|nr:hypothetical protein [Pseudomonadales bacterium]